MKKLQNKVFAIIFVSLSLFTIAVFLRSNVELYADKERTVATTLERMSNDNMRFNLDRKPTDDPKAPKPQEELNDDKLKRVFLDSTVYTVVLNDNGEYADVISHTWDAENDIDIENVANQVLNGPRDKMHIGNLFFDRFAYAFTPQNTLVIMDDVNINRELTTNLVTTVLITVVAEGIIFVIALCLTKWVTAPVKEAFQKQRDFIADASHELKTPLTIITASADAYEKDGDKKWVANIKNEAERMTSLTHDLLNLATSEDGVEIPVRKLNFSTLAESMVLTFESVFYERGVKLVYHIEPNIFVFGNEEQLKRLVGNLLDNASKYSVKRGNVEATLRKTNKHAVLEVRNKCNNLQPGDEQKIFERFYRADKSRNRDTNNYGLGLAIAKNIAKRHRGTISAEYSDQLLTIRLGLPRK